MEGSLIPDLPRPPIKLPTEENPSRRGVASPLILIDARHYFIEVRKR